MGGSGGRCPQALNARQLAWQATTVSASARRLLLAGRVGGSNVGCGGRSCPVRVRGRTCLLHRANDQAVLELWPPSQKIGHDLQVLRQMVAAQQVMNGDITPS